MNTQQVNYQKEILYFYKIVLIMIFIFFSYIIVKFGEITRNKIWLKDLQKNKKVK